MRSAGSSLDLCGAVSGTSANAAQAARW